MMMMKATNSNDFPIYECLKGEDFKRALDNLIIPIRETIDAYYMKWDEIGWNEAVA